MDGTILLVWNVIKVNILYIHFLELSNWDEQDEEGNDEEKKIEEKVFDKNIIISTSTHPANSMAAEVAKLMRAKFSDYDDIFLWNFMVVNIYAIGCYMMSVFTYMFDVGMG